MIASWHAVCVIHHAPFTIAGDLRSTFRHGMGAAWRGDRLAAAHHLAAGNGGRAAGRADAWTRIRLSRGAWLEELARP